jgi:hypothetical protein
MKTGSILDADMATVTQWLRAGWSWWVGELAELIPPTWRGRTRRRRPVARLRGNGDLMVHPPDGTVARADAAHVRRADLMISAQQCLEREIQLPAMRMSDVRDYVELERDRLFPLGGPALLCDAAIVAPAQTGGQQTVRIGAIRREEAETLIARASAAGIEPLGIAVCDDAHPDQARYDFARALRREGSLPQPSRQREIWWTLVAALFVLNVSVLIWRDQQSVASLQALVDAQQPAVAVSRAIASRNARAERMAAQTVARRAASRPLDDLALATALVPTTAWVQRYDWDGRTLELAGYDSGDSDLLAALRRAPRFANARANSGDIQADIPIGRPFGIVIDLGGGGR